MTNYSQNVANKRFITNEQRLNDHFAFRIGRAFFQLTQWIGEKAADDLSWALSNATMAQRVQWMEWYVDAMRIAGWGFDVE